MKSVLVSLLLLVAAITGSFAFRNKYTGGVIGTIAPVNAGTNAWLVSGTDTFRSPVKDNAFEFTNVKRGGYTLTIEAAVPYKNAVKSNIIVTDGAITNVGEVFLTQ